MRRTIFATLILLSLMVSGAVAQTPAQSDKPVWTIEVLKVKPGMFGLTLGYLDDNWMRVRAEAQRQGAILAFHRIAEQNTADSSEHNIVLLTEFKNSSAYKSRDQLFAAIAKQLPKNTSSVIRPLQPADLFDSTAEHVFEDYSDANDVRLRPLSRN